MIKVLIVVTDTAAQQSLSQGKMFFLRTNEDFMKILQESTIMLESLTREVAQKTGFKEK